MTNMLQNEYQPDYVSAPGETLLETLETIGMSQVELAKRMGRPVKTINEIIQKKAACCRFDVKMNALRSNCAWYVIIRFPNRHF